MWRKINWLSSTGRIPRLGHLPKSSNGCECMETVRRWNKSDKQYVMAVSLALSVSTTALHGCNKKILLNAR